VRVEQKAASRLMRFVHQNFHYCSRRCIDREAGPANDLLVTRKGEHGSLIGVRFHLPTPSDASRATVAHSPVKRRRHALEVLLGEQCQSSNELSLSRKPPSIAPSASVRCAPLTTQFWIALAVHHRAELLQIAGLSPRSL